MLPAATESGAGSPAGRTPERPARPGLARLLRWVERGSLGAGFLLLLVFASARLDRAIFGRVQVAAASGGSAPAARSPGAAVDQSLWSEGRIARYRESLGRLFAPPLAVLRIPRIGLEVAVLPGVDEVTLNRGVGHIPGTPSPGEPGNVAIAGHRDGFFRGLKDLEIGDRIELETRGTRQLYSVDTLRIVEPTEVQVLDPTPAPVLTLVTCYPFYFVGKAPQRFIVRAQLLAPASAGEGSGTEKR